MQKLEHTYAMKFPIKTKNEPELRKAIVFNKKIVPTHVDAPYYKLASIFNGSSHISTSEEGKLRKDVRIYEITP